MEGQLAALNTLDTENQPSAATSPFPSPQGHGGEGKGSAAGMFTGKLNPREVLRHNRRSPCCWVLGAAFPLAAQGLFGSRCTKLRAQRATCSSAALPGIGKRAQPFEKNQAVNSSTSF